MSTSQVPAPALTPEHFSVVTPWLISPSTTRLLAFLHAAFGAEEVPNSRITDEAGVVIHAVVRLGDATLQLFDARPGWPPTPSFLNLYVADVVGTHQKAVQLGATSVTEVTALWFGEKVCRILDPFGNLWWIVQRIEEVDFTDPAVAQRATTPEAIAGISYIQRSLNEAMLRQKEFFAARASE